MPMAWAIKMAENLSAIFIDIRQGSVYCLPLPV